MKKAGCGQTLLGFVVLVVIAGFGINSCSKSQEQARKVEEQRQASLTPEQRQAEDQAKAEAEAKQKKENELDQRKMSAEQFSKEYIREFLKHPDDASFGFWDIPEVKWNPEGDTFFVSSKVKAKNDFGAELTYQWATIITLNGSTWELVQCVMDGKEVYKSDKLLSKLKAKKQSADHAEGVAAKRAEAEAKKERQAEIEEAKWRTWTDASGKHKTEAKYSGMVSGKVMLIKRDGSKVQMPLEKLSEEDREWITNRPK